MAYGLSSLQSTASFSTARQLDDALVTGQIYPFMDNINEILLPYYASTMYEQLFIGNFVDRVHSFDLSIWKPFYWNPFQLKEATESCKIYCTLGWTVYHLEQLMNKTKAVNSEVLYYLTLFLDTYIPLMIFIEDEGKYTDDDLLTDYGDGAPIEKYIPSIENVFHQGNLPDVLHYIVQCSFFSDTRSKANPIVHLLSKSLPQRCTIRNLREIVSNYCRKYDLPLGNYKICDIIKGQKTQT